MSRISKALCTRRVLPLALLVLLLSAPAAALGGDWRLTPRFTVQETFTDNVAQTEVDPQDDFITELTPGISLRGRSRRLSSNVDYNFRRNIYANNPRLDDSNHQLQGRSDLEVIEDHVFVEANSTISQQLLNSQGFVSRNQRSRNGNRQDATRYEVSPRFRERFGSWATAEFRYSFDSVSFSADPNNNAAGVPLANPGNDTDQDEYSFDLNSGRKFARTPMSLTWDRRVNESGQGTDVFESLRGRIGYNVNRLLQLNFTAGEDSNSFRTSQSDNGGFFWLVGGTLTPSRRTTISGEWGDRFFGNTFNARVNHRHRRWNFNLTYDEQVRSANDLQRDIVLVPLEDGFGNPVFDPDTSSNIDVPLGEATPRNEASVSKRLRIDANYQMRRGTARVQYSENRQQFQLSDVEEVIRLLDASYRRDISPRTQWRVEFAYRFSEQAQASAGDFFDVRSSLSYELGPHTRARLNYSFADQGAAEGGREGYTEHSVTLGLVFNL